MNASENLRYNHDAADMLDLRLVGCEWKTDERITSIEKTKLVTMSRDACEALHSGEEHSQQFLAADAVVASYTNTARCICLASEASNILIHDQLYPLDALDQYRKVLRNHEYMLELANR